MGKLIVIEGACDGIGKSTQLNILKNRLLASGKEVVTHHFPSYGADQAKGVEEYLSGKFGDAEDLDPLFINSLYAYDRKVTWHEKLKKAYDSGKIILLDRYTTSSLIYQASVIVDLEERKKFIDEVCKLEYEENKIAKPDLVIFLVADFDLVKLMRKKRSFNEGIENDIHEADDYFMRKVYENSLFVADYLNFEKIKCDNDFSMKTVDEISNTIYNVIRKKIM